MNKEEYYKHFDKEELITIVCDYSTSLDLALKRIDKAIEYITRNCYKVCDKQLHGIPIISIKLDNVDNLLDILKGVDKE